MTNFDDLVDLAGEHVGGTVLLANDEFFAPKENLLRRRPAVFLEHEYTDRGKWMDGWETRRRREPGYDWCIIRLGLPGIVRGVIVDTSFFRGNYPEACSIDGCAVRGYPDPVQLLDPSNEWIEVLPKTPLAGDSKNSFEVTSFLRLTHLRLNIFPDGGVARLRVFGDVIPEVRSDAEFDLAAVERGGLVIGCNDMFFGSRHNLVMPGRAANMGEGWETRRRRGPGHDWSIVRLGGQGTIDRVIVDTTHFKGNAPDSCVLDACNAEAASLEELASESMQWQIVLPRTHLQPHTVHTFDALESRGPFTHVRLNIFPDGGISRLRVVGRLTEEARHRAAIRRLNTLVRSDLESDLRSCCGSSEWVRKMGDRRPYANLADLRQMADTTWGELRPEDWLDAFRHHPRIGESRASAPQSDSAQKWSSEEQAGTADSEEATREALVEANRAYEAHFGHIFIVCATGKSASEMLSLLEERMALDPESELRVAAEEQRKIMQIRISKLIDRGA